MRFPRRLAIAVLVGSAVPVVPLTLFSVAAAALYAMDRWDRDGAVWTMLSLVFLPSLVTVPIVAAASVIVGLPIHSHLVRTGRAGDLAYSLAGGLVGFALPMALVLWDGSADNLMLPMLGLVSGAATGHAWWKARPPGGTSSP